MACSDVCLILFDGRFDLADATAALQQDGSHQDDGDKGEEDREDRVIPVCGKQHEFRSLEPESNTRPGKAIKFRSI